MIEASSEELRRLPATESSFRTASQYGGTGDFMSPADWSAMMPTFRQDATVQHIRNFRITSLDFLAYGWVPAEDYSP
jgi:hypothetical protein